MNGAVYLRPHHIYKLRVPGFIGKKKYFIKQKANLYYLKKAKLIHWISHFFTKFFTNETHFISILILKKKRGRQEKTYRMASGKYRELRGDRYGI